MFAIYSVKLATSIADVLRHFLGSRPSRMAIESESCQTSLTPQTVTPRAKKLIIEFKSDGRNTAKGFRIPYVTYDG